QRGVTSRPGSVREARSEAGLSLAGVAGLEVTRAAIHAIETGRVRPSRATLELIATRTGKPMEFFLDPSAAATLSSSEVAAAQFSTYELEQAYMTEDYEGTLRRGETLLNRRLSGGERARVQLAVGGARVQRG